MAQRRQQSAMASASAASVMSGGDGAAGKPIKNQTAAASTAGKRGAGGVASWAGMTALAPIGNSDMT